MTLTKTFDLHTQPTAAELQFFQGRCLPDVRPVKAMRMMAASIGMKPGTYEAYYYGKRSKQMPARDWAFLRITWDSLYLAQWQRDCRPSHEGE